MSIRQTLAVYIPTAAILFVLALMVLPSVVGPEGWMPWDDSKGWFFHLRYLIHDTSLGYILLTTLVLSSGAFLVLRWEHME